MSNEMIEITAIINHDILQSGIREGIVTVFVPHTTAGITINENADQDVKTDLLFALGKAYPKSREYRHKEGNSDAHLKAFAMDKACSQKQGAHPSYK